MNFANLHLCRHYDSDEADLLKEFYRPVLSTSVNYDRAVGYFSSATFSSCASELAEFVSNNGQIRLIIGCLVSPQDINALKDSFSNVSEAEQECLRIQLKRTMQEFATEAQSSAAMFASLVLAGVVQLKFAVRSHGIYHEKFGVFTDGDGNKIAFNGSINETDAAWTHGKNHESFSVYQSVESEIYRAYGVELEMKFSRLWAGDAKDTRIYSLTKDSLALMREIASSYKEDKGLGISLPPISTGRVSLRPYQKEAIEAWADNKYRGILAMATGTGKTLTAIDAVKRFKDKIPYGAVIVTVPYQNLALQWEKELREQGLLVQNVFSSYTEWYERVKNYILAAQMSSEVEIPCLVCVNDTFKEERFQELLSELEKAKIKNHLIVVDECHHFNSPQHIKKLPEFIRYRLGLSATPYDQFAEHFLDAYFGSIVFEFDLGRAIREGFLTPYKYHVIPVRLDDLETIDYEEVTRRIVRIAGAEDGFTPEIMAKVQPLLLQRSRIVGAASQKLEALREHLALIGRSHFNLFYCGDGSTEIDGLEERQVELVSQLLARLGWRSSRITASESLRQRELLIDSLKKELIDAIVSIKVLDEGIDIPSCRTAYLLASQSSDRQGIQRRGRVLRKSDGKQLADIYDFVVLGGLGTSTTLQNLAKKELRRALRFSADAINSVVLKEEIELLATQLGITLD